MLCLSEKMELYDKKKIYPLNSSYGPAHGPRPHCSLQSHQPLPKQCCRRATLQLHKTLPWPAMGPAELSPTGPRLQGGLGLPRSPPFALLLAGSGWDLTAQPSHHPTGKTLVLQHLDSKQKRACFEMFCWLGSFSISYLEIGLHVLPQKESIVSPWW